MAAKRLVFEPILTDSTVRIRETSLKRPFDSYAGKVIKRWHYVDGGFVCPSFPHGGGRGCE